MTKTALFKMLEKPTIRIAVGFVILTVVMVLWNSYRTYHLEFAPLIQQSNLQDEDVPVSVSEPKDFTLKDAKGRPVKLSDFKGKPILLNFWATWCPPCLEEMPGLLRFSEWAQKELGLVVLAVSVDESWSAIDQMFKTKINWSSKELPITILLNGESNTPGDYGTTKFPETYFIDRNFKIVRKFVGSKQWMSQEIVKWITEHSK